MWAAVGLWVEREREPGYDVGMGWMARRGWRTGWARLSQGVSVSVTRLHLRSGVACTSLLLLLLHLQLHTWGLLVLAQSNVLEGSITAT